MSIHTVSFEHVAGADVYFRVLGLTGGEAGQVLDFADSVMKPLSTPHAVAAANVAGAGAASLEVATDIVSSLVTGQKLRVSGSTGNDGVYTIRAGSAYSAPNTTINVDEAVADATADGTIDLTATPYIAATQRADMGGTGRSGYTADLDLSAINPTGTVKSYVVKAYDNAAPAGSDNPLGEAPLVVQFGALGERPVRVMFGVSTKTTAGNTVQASAWLEVDGQVVDLPNVDAAATAAATLILFGQDSSTPLATISTANFGAANDDGRFEYELADPGFTADRQYSAIVQIVENGATWQATIPFVVLP